MSYMVADKENLASNILVRNEDEEQDVSYSQCSPRSILKFLCHHPGSRMNPEKKDQDEMQMKSAKRPS